jgi:predicted TIM-barrel fold metal-dependent hydrolase
LIIDGHFHVWPDHIAARALGMPAPDLVRFGDGTVAGAIATMDAAGIDRAVALGVANTGARVEAANTFVGELGPRFVGFGTIHPDLSVAENLASLRRHNLRGVKIHPLFQHFTLDDPRLWAIVEALQGEFAAIVHVGSGGEGFGGGACTPAMLRALALNFPRLDLIACHFGGYRLLEEAEELVVGLPIYLDTSWPPGVGTIGREPLQRIIKRHGAERIIFSSDWPMADPGHELQTIVDLGLSETDTAAILGGNLARMLHLA